MIKTFEQHSSSDFTFSEIFRELQDNFEIEFYVPHIGFGDILSGDIQQIDSIDSMFREIINDGDYKYTLIIKNPERKPYSEIDPYIIEILDRMEDKGLFLYSIDFKTSGYSLSSREYKSFPRIEEVEKDIPYPESINIVFSVIKRNLEPKTKFGKFINKFRDKNKTKYKDFAKIRVAH